MDTQKKHRRGGIGIDRMLRVIDNLDDIGCKGHKVLSVSSHAAWSYVNQRAKVERCPATSLAAAVVAVAIQRDLLTHQQWDDELRLIHTDKGRFNLAIDLLFDRLVGRLPDRRSRFIRQEAQLVWDMLKLPYSEEQLAYLLKANEYRASKDHGRQFTRADKQRFYYQPLDFDDAWLNPPAPKREKTAAERDALLESYAEAIADLPYKTMIQVIAVLLGSRLSNEGSAVTENVANPEEIPADNQDAIDDAFRSLMDGVL